MIKENILNYSNINLNNWQKHFLEKFDQNKRLLILHARMIGFDTICLLISLQTALNNGKNVLYYCSNVEYCVRIKNKINEFLDPKIKLLKNNKNEIVFESGGSIKFLSGNLNNTRGNNADLCIVSGLNFLNNQEEFLKSLECINSKLIVGFNADYIGSVAHKIWNDCNQNSYLKIKYSFSEEIVRSSIDGIDEKLSKLKNNMNDEFFNSEYYCIFRKCKDNRIININFRITEKEKNILQNKADEYNFNTISEYIRWASLNCKINCFYNN